MLDSVPKRNCHIAKMSAELPKPPDGESLKVDNGTLYVHGEPIESHEILREIGRGASGVVYLALHRTLNREEALKVWTKLREEDQRDKQIQGLKEAQKLAKVNGKNAVQIFDARKLKQAVIATMEYVPSVTLKEHIKRCTTVQELLRTGYAYLTIIEETTALETLHGDPHANNVLVFEERVNTHEVRNSMKLCDFGTSEFNAKGDSEERHWKSVWLTLVEITKRLPGSSEARTRVEHLRKQSIAIFKKMSEKPDVFSARDKARALTAFMRDYLDVWDADWRSDHPTPLESASDHGGEK